MITKLWQKMNEDMILFYKTPSFITIKCQCRKLQKSWGLNVDFLLVYCQNGALERGCTVYNLPWNSKGNYLPSYVMLHLCWMCSYLRWEYCLVITIWIWST